MTDMRISCTNLREILFSDYDCRSHALKFCGFEYTENKISTEQTIAASSGVCL